MAEIAHAQRASVGTSATALIPPAWNVTGVLLYIASGGSTIQMGGSNVTFGDGVDLVAGTYLPLPATNGLYGIIDAGTQEVQVLGLR